MGNYRVYGVLNAFNVWPCFLQVIFTDGEKLFLQNHAGGRIEGFEEIHTELDIRKNIIHLKKTYEYGALDQSLIAIGFSPADILIGKNDDIVYDFMCNQDKYLSDKEFAEDFNSFLVKYGV